MMVSVPSTEGYDGLLIGNQPVLLVVFNIEDDLKERKLLSTQELPLRTSASDRRGCDNKCSFDFN